MPLETPYSKSLALLLRHLTPAQKRKLTTDQCFEVQGKRYAYRIYVRRHAPPDNYGYATIYRANTLGGLGSSLCIAPVDQVPGPDWALALLLLIRCNEYALIATANDIVTYPSRRGR